jgi:tripartite-type tricarboxylate transporter receptor subunit TctC
MAALPMFIFALMPSGTFAEYPEKPVTFICPWPAGGATDTASRTLAQAAKKYFPKPFVVVNRGGGAGTIGTTEIIHSKPDGYTVGISAGKALTFQPHRTKLPYGHPDDYTPIVLLIKTPLCLAVKASEPWKDIKDFVAHAKANPGKVRIGHSGTGQTDHLNAEMVKMKAGIDVAIVPFPGSVENLTALLGGHIEAMSAFDGVVLPHIKAGKVRALGVFEENRNPNFPNVQTFREAGYDITMSTYYPIIGPKGLPQNIVSKLNEVFKKSMEDPLFVRAMEANSYPVVYEGPEDLKKRLVDDYKLNAKLVEIFKLN